MYYLLKLKNIADTELALRAGYTKETYAYAKSIGFLDSAIAKFCDMEDLPDKRFSAYNTVDTCAAEFDVQGLCGDHRSGARHPAGGSGKRKDQVLQGQQLGARQRHRSGAGGFHHDGAGRHARSQEHPGPGHRGHTGPAPL